MKRIETTQRTAQEVFEELSHRLKSTGHFPDEHFLLNIAWKNEKEFPKNCDVFCITDFGASEGIYTDVYLRVCDGENVSTERFATGKTLGESEDDLDRMNLIASAITQAFYSEGEHARFIRIEETEKNTPLITIEKQDRGSFPNYQEQVQVDLPSRREGSCF